MRRSRQRFLSSGLPQSIKQNIVEVDQKGRLFSPYEGALRWIAGSDVTEDDIVMFIDTDFVAYQKGCSVRSNVIDFFEKNAGDRGFELMFAGGVHAVPDRM